MNVTHNMVATALLVSLLFISACSDPVADAKRKYDTVKHSSASAEEICARGRAVSEAYLERGNTDGYREALVKTAIDCDRAKSEDAAGLSRDVNGNAQMIEPDDMSVPFNDFDQIAQ